MFVRSLDDRDVELWVALAQKFDDLEHPRQVALDDAAPGSGQEHEGACVLFAATRDVGQLVQQRVPDVPRVDAATREPVGLERQDRQRAIDSLAVTRSSPRGPAPVLRRDEVQRTDSVAPRRVGHRDVQRR